MPMFGGLAAKVNGHIFAGLFGRSTMVWLPEPERAEALALEGASLFDPMGDGRARSDKVMLPESMMDEDTELRRWIARAFKATALRPPKSATPAKKKTSGKTTNAEKSAKTSAPANKKKSASKSRPSVAERTPGAATKKASGAKK